MVNVKPLGLTVKRWKEGMKRTFAVPCPVCNKKSRGYYKCRWCGTDWTVEQIRYREKLRGNISTAGT